MRRNFSFNIGANSLICFSLALLTILYCLPVTIILPSIIRKPLLIAGLICFIVALLLINSKYFLIYVCGVCYILLFYYVAWSSELKFGSYIFPTLISVEFFVCTLIVVDERIKISKNLVWFILITVFFTALTSIIGLLKYPMATRILGQGASTDNAPLQYMYRKYNIAGWGLIYGIAFLEGSLMYEYKKNKKVIVLVMMIVDAICVLLSQLMFAIILTGIVVFFVLINGKTKKFIIRSVVCFAIFIIMWSERKDILTVFYSFAKKSKLEMIQYRIYDIMNLLLLKNTAGDAGARFELYMRGVNSFFDYPLGLFFVEKSSIKHLLGFHSDFFDIIGSLGLIGIIGLVSMFTLVFRSGTKMSDSYDRRFRVVMVGAFSVIFIINPILSQPHIWLFTLLFPAIICYQKDEKSLLQIQQNKKKGE